MTSGFAAKRDAFFNSVSNGPQLMGILNLTPDSFSDGGRFTSLDAARGEIERHIDGGASIIDIGAESTRPGFRAVDEATEAARLRPAFDELIPALRIGVSIDTTKASIAASAIAAGAIVVNDQWGLQGDPAMAETVGAGGAGVVIMHNRRGADPSISIIDAMLRFFDRSLRLAQDAGIPATRIVLDPGIGFGKTPGQNVLAMGSGIAAIRSAYQLPVLVGASRKSVFAALTGSMRVEDRLSGTMAAHLASWRHGATVFRVHDCREHRNAFAVTRAIDGALMGAAGA